MFINLNNFIGFESTANGCVGNTVVGNTAWNCGHLKLSEFGTANKSYFNVIKGNMRIYGPTGIEAGNCIGDIIDGNIIVKTSTRGIEGTFRHCTIQNNFIFDTNHTTATVTINAISRRNGGIVLRNNTANQANPHGNKISNNKIWRSGSSYTNDPDATTKTGQGGAIFIDTNYTNTVVTDNLIYNEPARYDLVDDGTTTINRTNDVV